MGGGTPRKSYTKIKNFTEKDQVRIKYSHIGKDKKLMLSVYIGEDVYKELTNGQEFKRLKVEYIPSDMVVITPINSEKEGVVHRYNGKGLFKTTCVRLSLSSYKTLKLRKKDFNNKVVNYLFSNRSEGKSLNVDLIGDKRKSLEITASYDAPTRGYTDAKTLIDSTIAKEYIDKKYGMGYVKPIEISAPNDDSNFFVSHDFLNDVLDSIATRLVVMEEQFEKRIKEIELLLEEFMAQPLRPLKPSKENSLDIDTLKQVVGLLQDNIDMKFTDLENNILQSISKISGTIIKENIDSSFKHSEIKEMLSKVAKDRSLFERIFGKD